MGTYNDLQGHADINAYDPRTHDDTGFLENRRSAFDYNMDEERSISPVTTKFESQKNRNAALRRMWEEGEIPEQMWDQFRLPNTKKNSPAQFMDWNGLASWASLNFAEVDADGETVREFKNDDEIEADLRESLKVQRDQHNQVASRAGPAGIFGQFVGATQAAFFDPVDALALGTGAFLPKAFQSIGVLGRVLTVAAEGGAAEAVKQPFVYHWKEEIESPYGAADAMTNIAFGTVLGGAFGATAEGVAAGLRKLQANARKADIASDPDAQAALEQVDELIRELDNTPDPDMTAADLEAGIHQAIEDIDTGLPRNSEPPEPAFNSGDETELGDNFNKMVNEEPDMPIPIEGQEKPITVSALSRIIEEERAKLDGLRDCIVGTADG